MQTQDDNSKIITGEEAYFLAMLEMGAIMESKEGVFTKEASRIYDSDDAVVRQLEVVTYEDREIDEVTTYGFIITAPLGEIDYYDEYGISILEEAPKVELFKVYYTKDARGLYVFKPEVTRK